MADKYPRVGSIDSVRPQGLCRVCHEPKSDKRIHVQFNCMRGDDEVYKAHAECVKRFKERMPDILYGVVDETVGHE